MRLLIVLLTFALFVGVLGFVATNVDTRVGVQVFRKTLDDLPLYLVVIAAMLVGIVYTGMIAIAEGAFIRLANRRLEKDVRRLETEVHFLRTQPVGPAPIEPDAFVPNGPDDEIVDVVPPRPAAAVAGESPASAPVYGIDPDDDDQYTGGRAV